MNQKEMFYRAGRAITDKHLTMMELLYGANPITDEELQKLIGKHPYRYGCYSGYIGRR